MDIWLSTNMSVCLHTCGCMSVYEYMCCTSACGGQRLTIMFYTLYSEAMALTSKWGSWILLLCLDNLL